MLSDPLAAPVPAAVAHAPTYWAATAGEAPPDDGELSGEISRDVVIIGAGYTGLCAALHLAENGVSATIIEANEIGWGCSGRSGGFVTPTVGRMPPAEQRRRFTDNDIAHLRQNSADALRGVDNLIKKYNIECDVRREGSIQLAHNASCEKYLKQHTDGEWLDREDIRRQFFRGEGIGGGVFCRDSFAVHSLKLAYGYARAAQAAGARIHCRQAVRTLQQDGGGVLLTTDNARIRARCAIFAGNGYAGEKLLPPLYGRTMPVLSSIIVTRPMNADEKHAANFHSNAVFYDTRKLRRYYRKLPDDRILMGGRGAIGASAAGLQHRYAALLRAVKTLLPPLADITAEYAWSGWINMTWDKMPHIARAPTIPEVIVAMGYNGSGIAYAALAGKHAATLALGRDASLPPPVAKFLAPFPMPSCRRLGQRLLYGLWTVADEWRRF